MPKIWLVQPNGTSLSWVEVPDDMTDEQVAYMRQWNTAGWLR